MLKRAFDYLQWSKDEIQGKKTAQEIYDDLAKKNKYEKTIGYEVRVKSLKKALSRVSNNYKTILDIACGTGALIDALPDKESLSITGVDISPEMLKVAKKRFQKYPTIKLLNTDFMKSSFPDNSFDLITISSSIRFVPKGKEKEFEEKISRWLKKDGTFLVIQNFPLYDAFLPAFIFTTFRGFNGSFHQEKKLGNMLHSQLKFVKQITVSYQYFLFKTVAYYFSKK